MNIYLVRHTAVAVESGVCYGQSEVDLDQELYRLTLNDIRQKLRGVKFDACFTSPSGRCKKLAGGLFGVNYIEDKRLMELNFGQWELKRWDCIDRKALDEWGENFATAMCPGGESFKDLCDRLDSFLRDVRLVGCENVLVVTHGGVIRAFKHLKLGVPVSETFSEKVKFGEIVCGS